MIIRIDLFVALISIVCCCLQVFAACLQSSVCCFTFNSLQAFSSFRVRKTPIFISFPVCSPLWGTREPANRFHAPVVGP